MVRTHAPVRTVPKPANALIVGETQIAKLIPALRAPHVVAAGLLLDRPLAPGARLAGAPDLARRRLVVARFLPDRRDSGLPPLCRRRRRRCVRVGLSAAAAAAADHPLLVLRSRRERGGGDGGLLFDLDVGQEAVWVAFQGVVVVAAEVFVPRLLVPEARAEAAADACHDRLGVAAFVELAGFAVRATAPAELGVSVERGADAILVVSNTWSASVYVCVR